MADPAPSVDRRLRSFVQVVQRKLAELRGMHRGVVVADYSNHRIGVYCTIGSGLDVLDRDEMRALPWIRVERDGTGWTCVEMTTAQVHLTGIQADQIERDVFEV